MSDVVRVENLRKRFGEFEALKGVSFNVPQGSVFGLIGPNGAGKTTLMSLILGYLDASAGTVEVLGLPPRRVHERMGKVATLPQDAEMPGSVSVYETLVFFGRLSGLSGSALNADIDRVLEMVDMREWRNRKIRHLSHGMKKRIGVAQAMLGKPELIVVDEPTAGLDPKHAYELIELFRKLRETATVLISSHNLVELEQVCDSAIILVKGEIVRSGAMDNIRLTDQQIHVGVAQAPAIDALKTALPGVDVRFEPSTLTLTLTFQTGETADGVTTKALAHLIQAGVQIRTVQRGQSLLQTYLQVS